MTTDQDKRRRAQQIGLANNTFGAAAGAVATGQAAMLARNTMRDRHLSPEQREAAARVRASQPSAARRVASKAPAPLRRLVRGGVSRLPKALKDPKVTLPAAALANVGAQALNGAMDGQSSWYFARELNKEKPVRKSDGATDSFERPARRDGEGSNIAKAIDYSASVGRAEVTSGKKPSRASREAQVALGAGAVGAAGYSGRKVSDINRHVGDSRRGLTVQQGAVERSREVQSRFLPNPSRLAAQQAAMVARKPQEPKDPLTPKDLESRRGRMKQKVRDRMAPYRSAQQQVYDHMSPESGKAATAQHLKLRGKAKAGLAAAGALSAGVAGIEAVNQWQSRDRQRNRWT